MMANTNSRMHIYRSHKINPFIWTHSIFFVFTYRLTQSRNSKSELLLAIMVLDILQTWTKIYITDACAWNVWLETFKEWFNGYILLSLTLCNKNILHFVSKINVYDVDVYTESKYQKSILLYETHWKSSKLQSTPTSAMEACIKS